MSNDMNRWAVAIRDSDRPAYVAIADLISEDIQSGRLSANQRLPTLRKLAKALKRNFATEVFIPGAQGDFRAWRATRSI
jgi:hypothetical protein